MTGKPTYEELERQIKALKKENAAILEEQKLLAVSEKFHRLTLENISDTVIITDDEGNIIYVCPNTINIFGLSQEEVLRKKTVLQLMGMMVYISTVEKKYFKL